MYYEYRDIEARACNHCCSGEVIKYYTVYTECVFAALHAPYRHLWSVRIYPIFSHYLINGTIFEKERLFNIECVSIFPTNFKWSSF